MAANIVAQIHSRCESKERFRRPHGFQMAAEHWVLVLLALCYGADGGTWMNSKATYLAGKQETYYKMDAEATYLAVHENEPNHEKTYSGMDVKATYLMVQGEKHEQKIWCNQCMRKEWKVSSYNENFDNKICEGHGRRKERMEKSPRAMTMIAM